jgi:hypothetical protein
VSNPESYIEHGKGGVMFVGPAATSLVQAITLKHSIEFYAKTGMKVTRMATPKYMLQLATHITGKKFKRGQYEQAAAALGTWIEEQRAKIPVVKQEEAQ